MTTNRTVIGNITLSLDGRIHGPGGEYDMGWIVPHAVSDAARDHMVKVTSGATTALLGRTNYQGFGGFWPAVAEDESADPRDRAFAQWLNTVEKVVFSTTLTEAVWQNSRIAAAGPAEVVKELRQQDGGDIVVLASTSVIQALLRAGELDRLSITLAPELVGDGPRLFADGLPATGWRPVSVAQAASGALCLLYDKVRDSD
ncbi:dihydrofolate reductase family protein [Microbispora bryophytorum]|uniref:Riboflavin biosynthesis protein RibD n=1 Tax=Microbispora bryophytorum TaxID=1460882 RepID=A0A8H9H7T8_9ACTN|nr:dihydrofolate reductase family protein [Microbispora bryophytorum]MBD3139902.1 dihydrofolate reductase [Microbispora bryophytorum]TQS01567.1 dihydrofolate reductase [Microbispora bryophytorum]GGO28969.1 riboflavin biosynthesis protein RibD [Microbispora bryophytorum]